MIQPDDKETRTKGNYKRSKQRERILALLRSTERHPTAAWVYDQLKEEFANLSMGTVYRNVNILMEQGLVRKIDFGSTFDRFEANTEPHYHLVCDGCHRIMDLETPIVAELNERVREATSFRARRHEIQFFGLCDECARSDE